MTNTTAYPVRLAQVIRSRQHQAGLTTLALAEAAHIPRTTLQRRLGTGDFTAAELAGIADVLGTTVSALAAEAESAA